MSTNTNTLSTEEEKDKYLCIYYYTRDFIKSSYIDRHITAEEFMEKMKYHKDSLFGDQKPDPALPSREPSPSLPSREPSPSLPSREPSPSSRPTWLGDLTETQRAEFVTTLLESHALEEFADFTRVRFLGFPPKSLLVEFSILGECFKEHAEGKIFPGLKKVGSLSVLWDQIGDNKVYSDIIRNTFRSEASQNNEDNFPYPRLGSS